MVIRLGLGDFFVEGRMTRTELIDALAAETSHDRKDAKLFLDALTQSLSGSSRTVARYR